MANLIVFGFFYIVDNKKVLLIECVLQGLAIYADSIYFSGGADRNYRLTFRAVSIFNVVSLFRMLRLLYLLGELKQFQTIIATYQKFQKPFVTMMGSLYTVYFFFSVLGQALYGGDITTTSR